MTSGEFREFAKLQARLTALERRLEAVLGAAGETPEQADRIEYETVLDECCRTLDFSPLKEYQRKKIATRTGKENVA